MTEFAGRLYRAGVPMVAGTDNLPGIVQHSELIGYVQVGLTPAQAIQIATRNGARYTGTEADRGIINSGRRADLILVDGEPTENIADIRRVAGVITQGRWPAPREVHEAIGIKPFVAATPPSGGQLRVGTARLGAAGLGRRPQRPTQLRAIASPSRGCDDRPHERGRMKLLADAHRRLLAFALLCVSAGLPGQGHAQDGLEYQNRGHYFEGIRPSPVSGFDIELLSSLVEHAGQPRTLPDALTLSFFADPAEAISLTVREVDNSHFYWLDRIKPETPWAGGRTNSFRWDTRQVLQRMAPPLRIADLGVLVRVGRAEPSADEHILPSALVADPQPVTVAAYRFTFKPCCDANVSCSLHAQNADAALVTQLFRRTPGGRPFSCRIDAATLAAGAYRLVLVGYLTETNQRIHQVVRFSHRPTLP